MSEKTFFSHIQDEESQNDFFISLLSATLKHDATVLNAIHEDLEFTDQAEIVATQRSNLSLSHPKNEHKRTLDWVVRDKNKLVGYESKTNGNEPSKKQLIEEHRKLERNSKGRDVFLYVFTDHPTDPIDWEKVTWISWYDVARQVRELDTYTDSIRLLQKMFDNKNYENFDGFESFEQSREWFTRHEKQIVQLAVEADRHLNEVDLYTEGTNHLPHHTNKWNLTNLLKHDSHSINQSIHLIPFHPTGQSEYVDKKYDIILAASSIKNELNISMHLHTSKNKLEEFVQSNSETLAQIVDSHGMILQTSWNRLNDPKRNFKEYSDPDEIKDVLSKKIGSEYWKRLYFGWEINTTQSPNEIVSETVHRISELYEIFYEPATDFDKIPEY
jgi:hypothetical protein